MSSAPSLSMTSPADMAARRGSTVIEASQQLSSSREDDVWPRIRLRACQGVDIALPNGATTPDHLVQAGQLAASERRQHVGEAIVVSHLIVLVPRHGLPCLS